MNYEVEYDNRARVPAFPEIVARWQTQSAETRVRVSGPRDVRYGPDPRQAFDLFEPAGAPNGPVAVFIHGGYWRSLDRKEFSFAAEGLLAHGVTVAIPSYRLCPAVKVADIIADLQAFLPALHRATGRRAAISGHSAGGHLTAALLATDWSRVAGVPADLARFGYAISGVFDLVPLVSTGINAQLRETAETARLVSPQHQTPPPRDRWLTAAVGGDESPEFIRQSVDMAATWGTAGIATEAVIVPRTNHFTVIDDLTRPASAMVQRIADMARRAAAL